MSYQRVLSICLLVLAASPVSAGGISSNGPVGQLILHCTGKVQILTNKASNIDTFNIDLSVYPQLGAGLVAKVAFDQNILPVFKRTVIKDASDQRGMTYSDDQIQILIPNIQNQQLPAGYYNALLTIPSKISGTAMLNCTNN